jgi:hypothetical protein
MPDHGRRKFQIKHTGYAKTQILALGAKAKSLGVKKTFVADLKQLEVELKVDPLAFAGLSIAHKKPPFTECFKMYMYFSIHYLVYESKNVVEILEIEVIQGHPLS